MNEEGDMDIPQEAVEAAARAIHEREREVGFLHTEWEDLTDIGREECTEEALVALEAAAPYIAAQAIRGVTDGLYSYRNSIRTMEGAVIWMRDHADKILKESHDA